MSDKIFFPKLVPAQLPTLTAWSYSRYADYRRCPFYFAYKHLLRIKDPPGPAMARGRDIHKEGEVYLSAKRAPKKVPDSYANFRTEMEQLRGMNPSVEQQWGFTSKWEPTGWFGNDTWARVVLDVSVVYPDATADVIDHKTGKKYGSNDEQMELFGLATFKKFAEMNLQHVTTRLWYLDVQPSDGNEVIAEFKASEVPALEKDWNKRVRPMFADKKFPPRPNDKCRWCFLQKAKGGPCKF
jgi:hypothetical protein